MTVPFIDYLTLADDRPLDPETFPGSLAFTHDLHLRFDSPVTFFVGENGSGKSTLLEAMAVVARLPIGGGGLNEVDANHAFPEGSILANSLRLAFIKQPKDRYFFRAETQAHFAETQAHFASLLDQRRDDPGFAGDALGATAVAHSTRCRTVRLSFRLCSTGSSMGCSSWTSRSRRCRPSGN